MDGLTEWDVEQLQRLADGGNRRAGTIVETKTGLTGRTYAKDDLVNGKIKVYTEKGNLLCDPKNLKVIGFVD